MGSFKLDPASHSDEAMPLSTWASGLTGAVLLHNAGWFIRIRWIVVAILTASGTAVLALDSPALSDLQVLKYLGLVSPGPWPLCLAVILALLNLAAIWWVSRLTARASWRRVATNIWFQIVSDLIILTALVYMVGATSTVVSFAYLFHVTLACIFFGRRDSFLVTLVSVVLFLGIVSAQCAGWIPFAGVLAFEPPFAPSISETALFAAPTVFVWLIVWYLVSSLSDTVRQRDRDLDTVNRRLIRADEEINLQMLRVTHDLKAPFSGIESNIQVLKQLHWDELPGPVREIIGRIDARSAALRARIGDILVLGSLRSKRAEKAVVTPVLLREVLEAVLQDVRGLADGKQVTVALAAGETRVLSNPEQLKILFLNLVSNAIVYSRDGGTVDVGVTEEKGGVHVSVVDRGIGISEKALPHIFEDFFRTQEASAFNPASTGLGLAIVRHIALNLGLTIVVESEQDKGAVFQVTFQAG